MLFVSCVLLALAACSSNLVPHAPDRPPDSPGVSQASASSEFARLTYATAWVTEKRPGFAEFKNWTQRYAQADKKSQRTLVSEGVALARSRRELLAQLIKSAPRDALDRAVPAAVRFQLPPEVVAELETRVSGRGDFLPEVSTPAPGKAPAPDRIVVKLAGTAYEAFVYGRRRSQTGKYQIPLHGIALDSLLALHDSPLRVPEPGELPPQVKMVAGGKIVPVKPTGHDGETATTDGRKVVLAEYAGEMLAFASPADVGHFEQTLIRAEGIAGPHVRPILTPPGGFPNFGHILADFGDPGWTTGPKRVLLIRVDFSDLPGEPFPFADLSWQITTYADPFYRDMSYGLTSLTTTVTPTVYRMPHPLPYYRDGTLAGLGDYPWWVLHADAQSAAAADYRLADYDRIVVLSQSLFPVFLGITRIGTAQVFLNGYFGNRVLTHELGHTYGLFHANLWQVTDGNPGSRDGSTAPYGDPYDNMAQDAASVDPNPHYHFNPWAKSILGWLPDAAITTVTSSGTYRLYHFDDAAANLTRPLALRVFRDGEHTYWIGFRHNLPAHPALAQGAYVFWGYNQRDYRGSALLDLTTPGTDAADAPLAPTAVLNDSFHNVSITNLGRGGAGADEYLDLQISVAAAPGFVAQWGTGFLGAQGLPHPLDIAGGVTDIAAGADLALALRTDGTVVAWSALNLQGEATVPAGLRDVISVAAFAGGYHSLALRRDGTVAAWGSNANGETAVPAGLRDAVAIAACGRRSLALRADGTVVVWGQPPYASDLPILAGLRNVTALAGGFDHALALKSDGTVVAWGDNSQGQCDVPAGLRDVVAIAAGRNHNLALRRDGTVVAWGGNTFGQAEVPVGLSGVTTIGAGYEHSLACRADGTLVAWGDNSHFACNTPVGAPPLAKLTGGWDFSLALTGPISANPSLGGLTATYDGTPHPVTVTTSPAGVTVTVLYNGSDMPPTNAGTYAIEATVTDPNYSGRGRGTLTIAPAPLTARANDRSRLVGAANPPLTIRYTGFVHGETEAVLSAPPTAHTDADVASPAGFYPITLSGGMAANYAFTLQDGTLEVYTFQLRLPPYYYEWPWRPWWWYKPPPFFLDLATLRTIGEIDPAEFWWRMNRDLSAQPGWSLRRGAPR